MARNNTTDRFSNRSHVTAGIVAGLVAGTAMALVAMFVSLAQGQGFWAPLYLIAGVFWGVNTLVAGPVAAVVGLLIHMVVSATFGAIFGLMVKKRTSSGVAFMGGLAYGVIVWAFMNYLVLPWANPTMNARVDLAPGWWFIEHLVFGGTLFITPALARSFSRTDETVVEEPTVRRTA